MKKFINCLKGEKDPHSYSLLKEEDERKEETERHTARMIEIQQREIREIQERIDRREREKKLIKKD